MHTAIKNDRTNIAVAIRSAKPICLIILALMGPPNKQANKQAKYGVLAGQPSLDQFLYQAWFVGVDNANIGGRPWNWNSLLSLSGLPTG